MGRGAIDCTTVVWLGLSWDISLARKKGGGSLPCRVEPGGTMPPRWACDPPSIKPPVSCPPTYHSTHSCSLHPSTNTNTNTKTNTNTIHKTSCLLSADPPSNPLCYNPFRRPFVHASTSLVELGRAWYIPMSIMACLSLCSLLLSIILFFAMTDCVFVYLRIVY